MCLTSLCSVEHSVMLHHTVFHPISDIQYHIGIFAGFKDVRCIMHWVLILFALSGEGNVVLTNDTSVDKDMVAQLQQSMQK